MTDLLEVSTEQVLLSLGADNTLTRDVETLVLLTEMQQGPPGPPGIQGVPGPVGDAGDALLVSNRLAELAADPATQEEAQANLGLGVVDPLAYYILAKA